MSDPKCKHCPGWEDCEWRIDDECWYEPNDYESDIGTATVKETEAQNEGIYR